MRRRSVALLAALFVGISLFLSSISPASAIIYSTGLKPGDTVMYSIFSGNNYYSSQMKVLGVSGTQVFVNFTDYPAPGVYFGNMWVDVFYGTTNSTSNVLFAVSPGLSVGDPVFNGNSSVIQSLQPYNCGPHSRSQVYTTFSRGSQSVRVSWDRSTGVMCEFEAYNGGTVFLGFKLDSTSLWSSSGSDSSSFAVASEISVALGLPLVVIVLFVYFRRRRSKARSRKKIA